MTNATVLILLVWAALLAEVCPANRHASTQASRGDVRFAAWNIRTFGRSKMKKPDVVAIITQIIQRYDVVLIQEVRDSTGTAIQNLLEDLNNQSPDDPFKLSLSTRLGRTQTKEQYAFLYRSRMLSVLGEYQYPDPANVFEREPYSVRFSAKGTALGNFVVMAIHTSPSHAKQEISALYDVFKKVKKIWNTERILIAGDLNAGCDYVRSWKGISLHSDTQFHWLITDTQDTTATSTKCPYDRVIAHDALLPSLVRGSTQVLHFDDLLHLSTDEALLVSDHYPIEIRFKAKSVSDVSHSLIMTWNDVMKRVILAISTITLLRN